MGGRQAFAGKLDTFFGKNLYWHGNEPGHQIAYLYDWAGAPWKTQNRIREILKKEYTLGPSGISGNDDTGQMSAWYVLTALGLYPVCPGVPFYAIGSPLFEEAAVRLGNDRTFTVRARNNSDANRYIQSARLNGRSWNRPWISHQEIARGGTLEFVMGPTPNPRWGADASAAPPSMTNSGGKP
jgi:predicted alpha-1,2-mannosidase